jgi:HK97 family phage portal protein
VIAEAISTLVAGFGRTKQAGSSDGWREVFGSHRTATGISIDENKAQTFSAVWCATRIISEGVAALPCDLREHTNERETRVAYEHPLWAVLHDEPNPEQDSFQFFDMQVPLQVNYGNAYAEIQRGRNGEIVALWPIHPSRIPDCNIVRGPVRARGSIDIGDDGEIVYLVRNNDGTTSPIAARDMLHVPGVMSENGITGKGIVRWAAESLGIIGATESHVGAFYRNGATPDIVITIPASVPKEERENLRQSWAKRQGGTDNAHKALILIGDSDAKPLGVNPNDSQLVDGRKFGVKEVSRFWKVPAHMLSDFEAAKYDNVELMNILFLSQTLTPWLLRWEKAMKRQLLTREERLRYSFKFNLKGMLRGDSAARSELYTAMFNIGTLSINEIRELEDMNPIEGGDRYFVQGNNYVPLDRIDDIALLQQTPEEPPEDTDEAAKALLRTAMAGLIGYEARAALRAAANPSKFPQWLETFYRDKFGPLFLEAVTPIAKMMREDVCAMLFVHATESKNDLAACMDAPVSEFAATVQRTVDTWSIRYQD